jgi:hypothetical protein
VNTPEITPAVAGQACTRAIVSLAVRITFLVLILNLVIIPSGMDRAHAIWLAAITAAFIA